MLGARVSIKGMDKMRFYRGYDIGKKSNENIENVDPNSVIPNAWKSNQLFCKRVVEVVDSIGGINELKRKRGKADNSKIENLIKDLKAEFSNNEKITKIFGWNNSLYLLKCLYTSVKYPGTNIKKRSRAKKKKTMSGNSYPIGLSSQTALKKIKEKCVGQLKLGDEDIGELKDEEILNIFTKGFDFVGSYSEINLNNNNVVVRIRDIRTICVLHLLKCEQRGLIKKELKGRYPIFLCDWMDHSKSIKQHIYKGLVWFVHEEKIFNCLTKNQWNFVMKPLLFLKGMKLKNTNFLGNFPDNTEYTGQQKGIMFKKCKKSFKL